MRIFVLDTSSPIGFFALFEDNACLFTNFLAKESLSSESLFPELEKALKEHQIPLSSLDLIGCGQGPGSYTGMRVGAAIAKTLSYALKIPLAPFCSLAPYIKEGGQGSVFDARSGGLYFFDGIKPKIIDLKSLNATSFPSILCTPEGEKIKNKFEKYAPGYRGKILETFPDPKIARDHALQAPQKIGELELLYLKETEAERSINES